MFKKLLDYLAMIPLMIIFILIFPILYAVEYIKRKRAGK